MHRFGVTEFFEPFSITSDGPSLWLKTMPTDNYILNCCLLKWKLNRLYAIYKTPYAVHFVKCPLLTQGQAHKVLFDHTGHAVQDIYQQVEKRQHCNFTNY